MSTTLTALSSSSTSTRRHAYCERVNARRAVIAALVLVSAVGCGSEPSKPVVPIDATFSSPTEELETTPNRASDSVTDETSEQSDEISQRGASRSRVARVVDGDTLEMTDGRTIRILGIDTPETVAPGQPVECYGPEASAFAKRKLLSRDVTLVGVRSQPDRYGRTLANVQTPEGDYAYAAVKDGYARVYNADTTAELRRAESAAKAAKRGLWAGCAKTSTRPKPTTTRAKPTATQAKPPVDAVSPDVNFRNCAAARAAGAAPLSRGDAGYSAKLDRDGDGIACE